MSAFNFSGFRLGAILYKEFIQMLRDRATLAIILGIPLVQLILFGFAINNNPKHLPTVVLSADNSNFTRSFIQGLTNTDYFQIVGKVNSEAEANNALRTGQAQFVVNIPPNFSRDLIRGVRPSLLLEADATDPVTSGNALGAITVLQQNVLQYDLRGLSYLHSTALPFNVSVHALYNPDINTQYNIVPGLMGVILTMIMVMITATAITRERERGTMENLLATPVQPAEVMIGKVLPYIIVGYAQVILILVMSHPLFDIPILGSVFLLMLITFPFIAANLAVGLLFSTVAKNQLQAIQMTTFFFLPSLLLSGFMFPFRGMPVWAQWIGQALPLTHYLRITRGILLKGNGWEQIWPEFWPILLFLFIVVIFGIKQFHRTLD
jgi:ABC-2 type transport system permease protein